MVCRFLNTTAPTKEGLLWDDKIVSNLHEQMCGADTFKRRCLQETRLLESAEPVSMVRGISNGRVALIVLSVIAIQGEYDVRPCRPALPKRCRCLGDRDRLAGIHVRGR